MDPSTTPRTATTTPPQQAGAAERLAVLRRVVRAYGAALVAFSGGVDSALVAAVAAEQLGERALAVTAESPSLPATELAAARELAATIGIAHRVVATRELKRAGYVANAGDRCYHCKSELYDVLAPLARERGAVMLNGTNADDLGDFRPGLRAATEHDVRSPLLEADCGKAEVRALARALGLAVWDKPAAACLASRIPVGTPVSVALLSEVEAAEAFLRGLGLRQVRVRHHGQIARIETDGAGMSIVAAQRETVTRRLTALGFRFVTLDLAGYCSGSLNPPAETPP